MTKEQEDTWLAALFDGEGGFYIGNDKSYMQCKMYITQAHCDELLHTVKETLEFGWVEPGAAWRVAGRKNCLILLDRIEPYLIVKKMCAALFREILGTVRTEGKFLTEEQIDRREELMDKWQATCTRAARNAQHAP